MVKRSKSYCWAPLLPPVAAPLLPELAQTCTCTGQAVLTATEQHAAAQERDACCAAIDATSSQAVRMLAHQPAVSTGNSSPPAVADMHLHSLLCTYCVGRLNAFKAAVWPRANCIAMLSIACYGLSDKQRHSYWAQREHKGHGCQVASTPHSIVFTYNQPPADIACSPVFCWRTAHPQPLHALSCVQHAG